VLGVGLKSFSDAAPPKKGVFPDRRFPCFDSHMTPKKRRFRVPGAALMIAVAAWSCGSGGQKSPARTAGQCAKMGAKTGVAGAKTGVVTGVEGVKAVGKTVGGFVEGGSDEARREWQQGKDETRRAAHSGAGEVKEEAHAPDCP
jgi:hypothetical protein